MRYMWYLGYLGDSVKAGESVREMHLHWPYNRLHVKRAIRVTKPRSNERWVQRLDRRIIRCWVVGHPTESGKEHLFSLVNQKRTSRCKTDGTHSNTSQHWCENMASGGYFSVERSVGEEDMAVIINGNNIGEGSHSLDSTSASQNMTAVLWYPKISTTVEESQKDTYGNGEKSYRVSIDNKWETNSNHWTTSFDRALILTSFLGNEEECDIALLVFDPSSMDSLKWLKIQQSKIPGHIPCRYVALERDPSAGKAQRSTVYAAAKEWCTSLELESPSKLSITKLQKSNAMEFFFEQVLQSGLEPMSYRPKSPERTWENQKRLAWLYACTCVGVAIAMGAAVFLRQTVMSHSNDEKKSDLRQSEK
jgi:hypothetical protein